MATIATAYSLSSIFLERFREDEIDRKLTNSAETHRKEKKERRVFCKACGAVVSHWDHRIAIDGNHQHRCTNPEGFVFDIGCFREAPGCRIVGECSSLWSWFIGYTWQISLCKNCHCHLGWYYDSSEDTFFGLILNRLISIN